MDLSQPIPLVFTKANALLVLAYGADPQTSPYSHKQIAEWCDRFWCQYLDREAPREIQPLLPVLTNVDVQWNLFLSNTYSSEQLRGQSFEAVRMPAEWFVQWLDQANA